MTEAIVLGIVQGIAEWLPISSEAAIILVKNNFFESSGNLSSDISYALFLHLGTLLSALVYYRLQVLDLLRSLFSYSKQNRETKSLLHFIFTATLVSGVLGLASLKIIEKYAHLFSNEQSVNYFVAGFLLVTSLLLYLAEQKNKNARINPNVKDGIITGLFQGFAVIPGVSRSGGTVAALGMLGFEKSKALELSFILSIPLVFLANIVLNFESMIHFNLEKIIAIIVAFIVGYVTIDWLVDFARRVRFSQLVLFFALLITGFSYFFL